MRILEEFWYGNIEPTEYDNSSKEYREAQKLIARNEDKLLSTMTEEQLIASELIQSRAFTKIVHHLGDTAEEAYLERILTILDEEYSSNGSPEDDPNFRYAKKEDRDVVAEGLVHVLQTKRFFEDESITDKVSAMDDEELAGYVIHALIDCTEQSELHQFHAAKAFTGYIDEVVKKSQEKAERRLKTSE